MRTSSFVLLSVLLTAVFVFFSCDNEGYFTNDSNDAVVQTENDSTAETKRDALIGMEGAEKVTGKPAALKGNKFLAQGTGSTELLNVTSLSRAFYPFENNYNDLTNGHNLTANGNVTFTTGAYGNAVSLNNSWLTLADSSDFNFERTDVLCFDFWVRRTVAKGEENIISRMQHADGNPESKDMRGWKIYFEDNGKVTFLLTNSWDSVDHKNTLKVQTISRFGKKNRWYHIELSYNGNSLASGVQIKVDGEVQTLNAIHNDLTDTIMTTAPLLIGGPNNLSESFTGQIDEFEINIKCYSNPCNNIVCGEHSHCETVNSSAACLCDTDYTEDLLDGTCINSKEVNCTDSAPANATSVIAPVTVTYTTADGWSAPANCEWNCNTDYTASKDGLSCINSLQVICADNAPVNAASVIVPATITYTTAGGWTTPATCEWNCNIDYISEDAQTCINSKQVNCVDVAPLNGVSVIEPVTVTYTSEKGWSKASPCTWNCIEGYHIEDWNCVEDTPPVCDGVTCSGYGTCAVNGSSEPYCICNEGYYASGLDCLEEYDPCEGQTCNNNGTCLVNIDNTPYCECSYWASNDGDPLQCITSKMVPCIIEGAFKPENSSFMPLKEVYYDPVTGWSEPGYCDWQCNPDYFQQGAIQCINQKTVNCTPQTEIPANSANIIAPVTITYTTAGGWTTPATCEWSCLPGYKLEGAECVEDVINVCENVTCSGIGSCLPSGVSMKRIGWSGEDRLRDMTVDSDGHIAYGGKTDNIISGTLSSGYSQLVAGIMDSSLNDILLHKNSESNDNEVRAIASGSAGFSLVTNNGNTTKILTVDHSGYPVSQINLSIPFGAEKLAVTAEGDFIVAGSGSNDVNVWKISPSGTTIWTKQLAAAQFIRVEDIVISANGGISVAGTVEGDLFGTSAGSRDIYIVTYDTAGNLLWNVQTGTAATDQEPAIAFDSYGNIYVTFRTDGSYSGTNSGIADAALVKYSGATGAELWRTQYGTSTFDVPLSIAVSPDDQIFVAGATLGSIEGNVNTGAGIFGFNTADVFVTEFDTNGTKYSTVTYGDSDHDWMPEKIVAVENDVVYVAGNTGYLDFEDGILFSDMFITGINMSGVQTYPVCSCPAGYVNVNNECIAEETCGTLNCGTHGSCAVKNYKALCQCDEGCHFDGISCVETIDLCAGVTCSGHGQCYEYNGAANCNCESGYTNDGDVLQCINQKSVSCNNYIPVNSTPVEQETTIYFNGNNWSYPNCEWSCNYGYYQENWSCINSKYVPCIQVSHENAYIYYGNVEITYNPETGWSQPAECSWECYWGYASDDGVNCINEKQVECVESNPSNAHRTSDYGTAYYIPGTGWSTAYCPWECDTDYDQLGSTCQNVQTVPCPNQLPDHAFFTWPNSLITYTTAGGWSVPESCEWSCAYGYISNDGVTCVNEKLVPCVDHQVANGISVQTDVIVIFNPNTGWEDPGLCPVDCNADYTSDDGITCINQKYVPCAGLPANATLLSDADVLVTFTDAGGWTAPESCEWTCKVNYSQVGNTCVADTRTVDCQNTKPEVTQWKDSNPDGRVFQTWNGESWVPSEYECAWGCDDGYTYQDGECVGDLPPYEPFNPVPVNGAQNIAYDVETFLLWESGDPYGADVTYEVKFDTVLPPQKIACRNITIESCSVGMLTHGKQYFWQVIATNAYGKFTSGPIWSFTTAVNENDPAPEWTSGSSISAPRVGSSAVELSWSAAADNIGVKKYIIYGNGVPLKTVMSPALSTVIIPLEPSTEYDIKIEACDDSRCSENGPETSFTTLAVENTEVQYEELDESNYIRFIDRYRSLYRVTETTDPVQHFVLETEDDDYSPVYIDQASIVTGYVMHETTEAFVNALVYVKDHPEYGYTYTGSGDNAGKWTMMVNGGPAYVFVIQGQGHMSIQRTVKTEPEVVHDTGSSILVDNALSLGTVDLNAGTIQFVESQSHNNDLRGQRQATIAINADTEAFSVNKDGTYEKLDSITIQQVEYTKTINGKIAMPAPLPENIAYTYCVELTVAEAPDAKSIVFSKPVYYYLDNFLNFPVGTAIPNGSYDREKTEWIPGDDGVVISIVSIKTDNEGNEIAELDIDGDNVPEPLGVLYDKIEITMDELRLLAGKYGNVVAGGGIKTIWRVPLAHFSPCDLNLLGISNDAVDPDFDTQSNSDDPLDCENSTGGSIIGCESRTLKEKIDIPGTEYSLYYHNKPSRKGVTISLNNYDEYLSSGGSGVLPIIKGSVNNVPMNISSLGNSVFYADWNGKSESGSYIKGVQTANISVGYEYPVYYLCEKYQKGFSSFSYGGSMNSVDGVSSGDSGSGGNSIELPDRSDATPCGFAGYGNVTKNMTVKVENQLMEYNGFGNLTIDVNSKYDSKTKIIHRGDGTVNLNRELSKIIYTLAEGLHQPHDVKLLRDGSAVFVDGINSAFIKKISPSGKITTIAGGGSGSYENGMSPLDADIMVVDMTVDSAGRIYFTDYNKDRILKIDLDRRLYIVGGNGFIGSPFDINIYDGQRATEIPIFYPSQITVSKNNTIYFLNRYDDSLRKISPDGIMHVIKNNMNVDDGEICSSGSFGKIALTSDEKAVIALVNCRYTYTNSPHYSEIIKIALPGKDLNYNQDGVLTYELNGVTHTKLIKAKALISKPFTVYQESISDFSIDGDSENIEVYYSYEYFDMVRRSAMYQYNVKCLNDNYSCDYGTHKLMYGGEAGINPDVDLAGNAKFYSWFSFSFIDKDNIVIADSEIDKIRKIGTPVKSQKIGERVMADKTSGNLLLFNHYGRHLKTIDPVTNTELHNFEYETLDVDGDGSYSATVLSKITDVDGRETIIDRSDPYNVRIISPDGHESRLLIDEEGLATEFIQPDGSSYVFNYSATKYNNLLTKITYPNGRYTEYTYDIKGYLEKVIDQKTNETVPFKKLYAENTENISEKISVLKKAEGAETRYLSLSSSNDMNRTTFNADGSGVISSEIYNTGYASQNINDGETITSISKTADPRFSYQMPYVMSKTVQSGTLSMVTVKNKQVELSDPFDLLSHTSLTETTNINGKVWSSVYNTAENSYTLTTPMSRVSKRYMNAKGRTTSVVNPDVDNVNFSYRADGRIETVSQGSGTEERILSVSYYSYTDETTGALKGEIATVVDPELHTVDFEYDLMGRVTRKIFEKNSADERVVEYVYDESGNVLAVTPAGRPAHNFYYDSVDLPNIYDAPAAGTLTASELRTQYFYNLDRQLESILRPDGTSIYLTYELTKEGYATSTGKLQKITVPGRGDITLTYKTTGGKRLDTVTTPEGNVLSYTYNGALMASESWSGDVTGTVSRTYNNDFRTTAVTSGGISAGYTYDNDGLLLSAGDMTITRDTESGMITGTALDSITTAQSYNSFGEISTYDAGDFSYAVTARDRLGRITEKTETVEGVTTTYNYTYDTAGRLAKVWENGLLVSEYTYDDNGNRLRFKSYDGQASEITYGYDDQDRLVSGAYSSYTYTANGDVLTKTNVLGTTTYTHDALGNLTEVILPNNDEISYIYDGRNRLISKQVNGIVEYRLIYAGQLSPIAKVDGSGNTIETYIYGLGVNSPDYILKDGTKYRVIKDHLGSTRMIINASTGEIVKTISYSEFGEITEETGTFDTIFGFAGGIRDTDTNLTKFGARWYDSATGRWMEKEPLGFAGSDNFYNYCDGDPVNFVDVTGLKKRFIFVNDDQNKTMEKLFEKMKNESPSMKRMIAELEKKLNEKDKYITIETVDREFNQAIKSELRCEVDPTLWEPAIGRRPPEVGLAHELIHLYNHLFGLLNTEASTVGHEGGNPYTENGVRDDIEWPRR